MTRAAFLLGLALSTQVLAGDRGAATHQPRAGWWRRHLADTAFHIGATSLDAASSWQRPELNPLLRSADGRFGARGVAIKFGICGGVELIKWRLARRHPDSQVVRAMSLVPGGVFASAAARNWRMQ